MEPPANDGSQAPEPARSAGVRDRFPALYGNLREVAAGLLGRRESPSLSPTDLVHEAFLELQQEEARRQRADRSVLGEKPDEAFKACFGAACRDLLVDRLRRRLAKKRGGGQAHAELHSTILLPGKGESDTMEVHDAIAALAELDADLAQLVEARVFGELSVPECAKLFAMSPRTVDRRWAFALAWLREKLR